MSQEPRPETDLYVAIYEFWVQAKEFLKKSSNVIPIITGFLYIVVWVRTFKLRLKLAPHFWKIFIFISILDFVLLLVHTFGYILLQQLEVLHHWADLNMVPHHVFIGRFDWWMHKVVINHKLLFTHSVFGFTAVSTILALCMAWHHHRMTKRVRQLLSVLSNIRIRTGEVMRFVISEMREETDKSPKDFIETALQALTDETTELRESAKLIRTGAVWELVSDGTSTWFELYAQWPLDYYPKDLRLSSKSAAGRSLECPEQEATDKGIIYIPWTVFPHGSRHLSVDTKTPSYCRLTYERNAFTAIPYHAKKPKSLLCMEIPVASERQYVLCLDSNRRQCFAEADFQIARLIANLIGIVLGELPEDKQRSASA